MRHGGILGVQVPTEERGGERWRLGRGTFHPGIEPHHSLLPSSRVDLPREKTTNLRLAEDVVASEHLVGALPSHHHLVANITHKPRQEVHRSRRRTKQRMLGVPHNLWKDVGDIAFLHDHLMVARPQTLGDEALKVPLIVLRVAEAQRESIKVRVRERRDQRRRHR